MLKPIGSCLLCEEEQIGGKLQVQDTNKPVIKAIVLEMGLGDYKYSEKNQPVFEPMQVRPGMTVYFRREDAISFEIDGQKLFKVHQDDLLCYEE